MYEGKVHFSLIMTLILTSLSNCDETTDQYLQRSVKHLRQIQIIRRGDIAHIKEESQKMHRRSHQYSDDVPPLSLTKGDLAALYDQAAIKGETIQLDTGNNEYSHALVHHLDEDSPPDTHSYSSHPPDEHYPTNGATEDQGYYYYYYPIKSFLEEFVSQPSGHAANYHKPSYYDDKKLTTHKPPFTYHSHHHEHNVTIQTAEKQKHEAKPLEPLFMAISGFIGMAVMFVVSMVILPKFGIKPKVNNFNKKDKLDDFARFALNAIEGNCAERFACELTKTARSFDVEENRFYKLLKRMAPGSLGRLMNNAEKYSNKQLKCTAIPCKRKVTTNNINSNNKKTSKNNQKKKNNVIRKH